MDGRHYWFVEKTTFEEKADSEDGFLERCAVADVRVAETAYHVQDRHEDGKPYLYGLSFEAIRTVSAGGKLLLVEVSLDGVRAMKSNPAVDAFVVHAGVTEPATLRERLRARLKEDESTIQKRLEFARAEWEIAQPGGPAVELADGETPSNRRRRRRSITRCFSSTTPMISSISSKFGARSSAPSCVIACWVSPRTCWTTRT